MELIKENFSGDPEPNARCIDPGEKTHNATPIKNPNNNVHCDHFKFLKFLTYKYIYTQHNPITTASFVHPHIIPYKNNNGIHHFE